MVNRKKLIVFTVLFFIMALIISGCENFFPPPEPTNYTIISTAGDNGSISPQGEIILTEGEDQSFAITPDTGYEISDVLIDGKSTGKVEQYTFTDIQQNHTIQASFIKKLSPPSATSTPTYIITATAETGGTIEPFGSIQLQKGEEQSFTIAPDAGYEIYDVLVDDVSIGAESSYTFDDIQQNHTIQASFIALHTITATTGDNGSITPEGEIIVTEGGDKTFTIIPDACYQIEDVIVDGESVDPEPTYIFDNIKQNHSIVVSFTLSDAKVCRYNQSGEFLSKDYTCIQDAIDEADNGDTIIVCPGTYNINLVFDSKNITVRSADPLNLDIVENTIINGDIDKDGIGDGSVVSFTGGDTTTLEGFTIQNGNAEYGGGIYIFSSTPSIIGNTIKSNKVTGLFSRGGAIYAKNSTPNIENNNIIFNTASEYCGGGIYLENCMLIGTDNKIFNNTISDNEAKYGGGIILLNSSAEVSENLILNNSATYGGGNYIANNSNVLMNNNTITENIALSYDGGGIFVKNSSLVLNHNDLNYNKADSNRGGGIYIENGNVISIQNNTVQYNEADFGGGIYITQSSPEISENTIQYNKAKSDGGGIFVDPFSDIMPDTIRTEGWGSNGDDNYRENIPVTDYDTLIPSKENEYAIANNTFFGNEHGEPLDYSEGAHVYFKP